MDFTLSLTTSSTIYTCRFVIIGDDVFVHAENLADMLSPFNPNEDWTFSQVFDEMYFTP
jgi:hypothetical protein